MFNPSATAGCFFSPGWSVSLPAFSASCTLLGGQKDDEQGLLLAADRFNKDLRWEDYKSASSWIAPAAKEAILGPG